MTTLRACFEVADKLRAAALDPFATLDMAERRSLAAMASAVETAAMRRTDVALDRMAVEAGMATALTALERQLQDGPPYR